MHITDIHLWYSVRILETLEESIIRINPDLIILTGDYYDLPKGAHNFREFLSKVSLRHTLIFIRGNHDKMYGTGVSDLLLNIPNCFCVETSLYKHKSKQGCCYNITSWKNRNNLPNNSSEKNIVLIHNPEKIKENELSKIHLILAGHLHGVQFIFFKTKNSSHFPGNILYKYCLDRKQIMNTTLIVSKGLGDTFPFRLNCPKEIVLITIR